MSLLALLTTTVGPVAKVQLIEIFGKQRPWKRKVSEASETLFIPLRKN